MKTQIKKIAFFIFLGLFFSSAFCLAEEIDSFSSIIKINADATVNFNEVIDYNFGDLEKHGIYRYIPVDYTEGNSSYSINVDNISVTDTNLQSYNFTDNYSGRNLNLKIGDANVLVSGLKTYVIKYDVVGAINYFSDHDEFYWNVNGSDWPVTILKSKATVFVPFEIKNPTSEIKCFYGPRGSKNECNFSYLMKEGYTQVDFEAPVALASGEDLTIALSFPKGLIAQNALVKPVRDNSSDSSNVEEAKFIKNFTSINVKDIAVSILLFIVFLFVWFKFGKEPKGRGVIIPQYDVPDGLTPIQVGTITDESTDNVDISAQIIYLAINGYLKITKLEKSDYQLEKLKDDSTLPNAFDKLLMSYLFSQGKIVKFSDIRKKGDVFLTQEYIKDIKDEVKEDLQLREYFRKSSSIAKMSVLTICGVLFYFGFSLGLGIVFIFSTVIVLILTYSLFSSRLKKGVEAKEYINGLKLYLSVAEKRRIDFHNDPKSNPKVFEKFLPYAMVLGVEKKWAEQFNSIYLSDWYVSSNPATFIIATDFIHDMSGFRTATNNTFAVANVGAGSGMSAFSGGGFSGGGGGGGGGGSW